MRHGTLTKYQATAIYQGKAKGLVFGEYFVLDLLGVGVWIIVRDKDGNELVRIKAPDGSSATIEPTDRKPLDKPVAQPQPQPSATPTPAYAKSLSPTLSPKPIVRLPLEPDAPLWTPPVGADGQMLMPPGRISAGLIPRPVVVPGLGNWRVETLTPPSGWGALSASPDDRFVACTTDFNEVRVRIYDRSTLKLVAVLATPGRQSVTAWSPDGKWLAIRRAQVLIYP